MSWHCRFPYEDDELVRDAVQLNVAAEDRQGWRFDEQPRGVYLLVPCRKVLQPRGGAVDRKLVVGHHTAWLQHVRGMWSQEVEDEAAVFEPVSYTHLTLPTKRIV